MSDDDVRAAVFAEVEGLNGVELIMRAGGLVEVGFEDLRVLFDTAVTSLDFGSGFWDIDMVEAAQRIAVILGVDPREATPSQYSNTKYPHAYVARFPGSSSDICRWCSGNAASPIHQERAEESE